jgi:hypothetical protein
MLFDHLVGAGEQFRQQLDSERLGGLREPMEASLLLYEPTLIC